MDLFVNVRVVKLAVFCSHYQINHIICKNLVIIIDITFTKIIIFLIFRQNILFILKMIDL